MAIGMGPSIFDTDENLDDAFWFTNAKWDAKG